MNKRILALVSLFSLAVVPFSVSAVEKSAKKNILQNNPQVQQFLSSYMGALVMGGTAGAVVGTAMGYLQKQLIHHLGIHSTLGKLLVIFAACNFGSEIRDSILAGIESNLDDNGIAYQESPMAQSAFIASLLAYLHA